MSSAFPAWAEVVRVIEEGGIIQILEEGHPPRAASVADLAAYGYSIAKSTDGGIAVVDADNKPIDLSELSEAVVSIQAKKREERAQKIVNDTLKGWETRDGGGPTNAAAPGGVYGQIPNLTATMPVIPPPSVAVEPALPELAIGGEVWDPFQAFNITMTRFNLFLDANAIQPVARVWEKVPKAVRDAISRFFVHLRAFYRILNNILQAPATFGKTLLGAARETGRTVLNSIFGIGGLFDVAAKVGLAARPEDDRNFCQTLRKYGVPSGPYIQMPFLEGMSACGLTGFVIEQGTNPTQLVIPMPVRIFMEAINRVNDRPNHKPCPTCDYEQYNAETHYFFLRDTNRQAEDDKALQ